MDSETLLQLREAVRTRVVNGTDYQQIEAELLNAGYTTEEAKSLFDEVMQVLKNESAQSSQAYPNQALHPNTLNRLKTFFKYMAIFVILIVILMIGLVLFVNSGMRVESSIRAIKSAMPEYLENNNNSLDGFCQSKNVVRPLNIINKNTENFVCKSSNTDILIQYSIDGQHVLCMKTMIPSATGEPTPGQISCLTIPYYPGELELPEESVADPAITDLTAGDPSSVSTTMMDDSEVNVNLEPELDLTPTETSSPDVKPDDTTVSSNASAGVVTQTFKIISPKSGDQFCIEDGMTVVWESNINNIDYYGLGMNKPNSGLPIGQQLSYRDSNSDLKRYEYEWDFRDRSGGLIQPGNLYSISIAAFTSSGNDVERVFSDGRFSVIDCY
jgi:hypothetical protein